MSLTVSEVASGEAARPRLLSLPRARVLRLASIGAIVLLAASTAC